MITCPPLDAKCDATTGEARLADTPGRGEFGVVKKSGVQLDRLQNFRKDIHKNTACGRRQKNLDHRAIESSLMRRAVKKARRPDKQPNARLTYV